MIQIDPVVIPNENETPVNLQALGEEAINSPMAGVMNTPLLPVYEEGADLCEDQEVAIINSADDKNMETTRDQTFQEDTKTVLSARKRSDVRSVISSFKPLSQRRGDTVLSQSVPMSPRQ